MAGTVDIFHSRRTNYQEVIFWIRNQQEAKENPEKWILTKQPSGTFYCKEVTPSFNQFNTNSGVYGYDKDSITLETDDDINEISRGSVILYNGRPWIVNDVQRLIHKKESEFNSELDYKYIINIRR